MVGRIAQSQGRYFVGIAGGGKECALALKKFRFDHCLDQKVFKNSQSMKKPYTNFAQTVKIFFENVARKTLDAILPLMNAGARLPLSGMISWYSAGALGTKTKQKNDKLPKL